MRLLLAEDDRVLQRMLGPLLSKWGHEVIAAYDGDEAWEVLRAENPPQLVLLDWIMPGLDGVEICRRVRELKTPIRPHIILLTAMDGKHNIVVGIDAGADDYITKPFDQEELRVRLRAGERILEMQAEMLAAREALRFQATHDALTGMWNRTYIMDRLKQEIARSARSHQPLSVISIDLDHFKKVNDVHGHAAGDAVLIEVAKRITSKMRPYEDAGRIGGEEFLAVLAECDLAGAERAAERLREVIASKEFSVSSANLGLTASFGVACSTQLARPSDSTLIGIADAALYLAKQQGRNRVARGVAPKAS